MHNKRIISKLNSITIKSILSIILKKNIEIDLDNEFKIIGRIK